MILDVYPSRKDEKMVELLYKFERDTRLSLNILVENYLEKLLHDKGYLGVKKDCKSDNSSEEISSRPQDDFRKTYYGSNGRVRIWKGKLCFGSTLEENYSYMVDKLKQFSLEELSEISSNNWDKSNGEYMRFLKWKLKNPKLSLENYLRQARFSIRNPSEKSDKWQIRHEKFSLCSGNNENMEEFLKIKNYLFNLSDDELTSLKEELKSVKHRRKHILERMGQV